MSEGCTGEHHYFMASEVEVPAEGKLVICCLCTNCGKPLKLEYQITDSTKEK